MDYISIDNFEGPLDLLLHLVKEANIDICDISIEEITDKYLDYINHEENLNINISSSYLVMASELMYIKSKSLLPKRENEEEEEEELTRENLINKLIEYKKYKNLTGTFRDMEEDRRKIFIKGPEKYNNYMDTKKYEEESVETLIAAFKKFLDRRELEKPLNTTVTMKEYSINDRKKSIRNILRDRKSAYLEDLIEEDNKPYFVVTFLGILEMVKEKDIVIKQDKNFDRILVELRN